MDTRAAVARLPEIKVIVIDDEPYMRKVVRTMLIGIGVRNIYESPNGPDGLELIRTIAPDVVILDWQMPGLDGPGVARIVRSPQTFPYPNVPIIMLTSHGERSRVLEAIKIGINEFLLKPVSSKALKERLVAVLANPRRMMQGDKFYGPAPRNLAAMHEDDDERIRNLYYVS